MAEAADPPNHRCPFCQRQLEIGCLLAKDSMFRFQWYEGDPTFWKNLLPQGMPMGEVRPLHGGLYLKGGRCDSCHKVILDY